MVRKSTLQERLNLVVEVIFDGSNKDAAEAARMPPPTLHRILTGEIANPSLASIERLAAAYRLPVSWLVGEMSPELGNLPVRATWWWLLDRYYGHQIEVHMKHFKGDAGARIAALTHENGLSMLASLVRAACPNPERAPERWINRVANEYRVGVERLRAVVDVWLRTKVSDRKKLLDRVWKMADSPERDVG